MGLELFNTLILLLLVVAAIDCLTGEGFAHCFGCICGV